MSTRFERRQQRLRRALAGCLDSLALLLDALRRCGGPERLVQRRLARLLGDAADLAELWAVLHEQAEREQGRRPYLKRRRR